MTTAADHHDAALAALHTAEQYDAEAPMTPIAQQRATTLALLAIAHLLAASRPEPLEPVIGRRESGPYGFAGLVVLCATTLALAWIVSR